jgi:serine/threonine-protein kinase
VAVNSFFKKGDHQQEAQDTPRRSIGQYKVQAARAYFHDEADASTRRTAYMIPSNDVVTALEDKNGFIYTEFTNGRGQTSKGWLKKADLVPLGEWKEPEVQQPRLTPADIRQQLGEARTLLERNQFKEALYIYSFLAEQQVPEALYEYGNLALQKKNEALSCGEAYQMVVKASDKGYAPAKRTLGFLYIFADNPDILRLNEYENCSYERNVFKGTKLLTQATFAGDSTARRLLDELRLRENQQPAPDTTTVTPPEQ